ncbi:MAG: hypothetical protein WCI95_03140 [bacterium]
MKYMGIIKATTATLNVGLGFIPRKVRVTNLTDLTEHLYATDMRAGVLAETHYGISRAKAGDLAAVTTAAAGIVPYVGGTLLTADSTTCLERNDKDMRVDGATSTTAISTFTVGSVANKTGNFNVDVSSSGVVGAGSVIIIKGVEYYIVAVVTDGSTGGGANEVTLSDLPAGAVAGSVFAIDKIRSRFDLIGAKSGKVTLPGITIGASATVNNTDGDVLLIEAEDC